jgi:molybdopterin/thiamine biosynthesis adenylyltransferase
MALANFFDKISLGAAQRIKNYDRSAFEDKLLATHLAIVYGEDAVGSREGNIALDLAVRILSRLYPNIQLICLVSDEKGAFITKELQTTALNINPELALNEGREPHINLVIGKAAGFIPGVGKCFYVGSNGWKAYFSPSDPLPCGVTQNPFGAATAICFAAGNIFRYLFAEELGQPTLDSDVCFSVFSQKIDAWHEQPPELPSEINLGFTLVGTGAIGNAVLWSLLQLKELSGFINLLDDQDVSLTNLQRYVLMFQEHIEKRKVEQLKMMFAHFEGLRINPFPNKWQTVISRLTQKDLELFVVALDSKEERLRIQSVMPKKIINAWTSQQDIGVSRHFDFAEKVCLSCLYIPNGKQKSESVKIAESLKLPEGLVRSYIANNVPVDESFIFVVSQSLGVDISELRPYVGKPIQIFYSEGICGERIIKAGNGSHDLDVPLAHESILAGILAAAEIIIESAQLRQDQIEPLTKINLLMPLHNFLLEEEFKNTTGRCICVDQMFVNQYRQKWS